MYLILRISPVCVTHNLILNLKLNRLLIAQQNDVSNAILINQNILIGLIANIIYALIS